MTYTPTLHLDPKIDYGADDIARARLQQAIIDGGLTHIETTDGTIWRIFQKLNKKTVSLNHAVQGPQRLPWAKIVSFGVMEEDPQVGEGYAPETTNHAGHSGRAHALLSASSSHRWIHCTPSARLEATYPDTSSEAAAEGTAAHELAEYKLRQRAGQEVGNRPTSKWDSQDLEDYTDAYVTTVIDLYEQARKNHAGAFLAVEKRLDFSHIVPDGFGTGDAIIISDDVMTIFDLKYGKGVPVSAVGNSQMRLYALGALHTYGMIYNITQVRMMIFQPRLNNISTDEISVIDLMKWADEVVTPAAAQALAGQGELTPGDWCQFCKHTAACPALASMYLEVVPTAETTTVENFDPPAPTMLTDEQIANIVTLSGDLKKWLSEVEAYALDQANNGHTYPGLKLVEGRSVRKYGDENAVIEAVRGLGKDPWEHKILGITAMSRLLGKKTFDEVVSPHLVKPAGKPTLVPESDKRPALPVATPDTVFTPLPEGEKK